MIDHRAILVKYLRLVREYEGTTFTGDMARALLREEGEDAIDRDNPTTAAELAFADDEWAELQRLADEVGPQPPLPMSRSLLTYETDIPVGDPVTPKLSAPIVIYGTAPSDKK